MNRRVVACAIFSLAVSVSRAEATARTLSSATDGNWDDPASWVDESSGRNTVPTKEDTVVINSHTIIMTSGESIAGFHLKDGTLNLGDNELISAGAGSWDRGMITGAGGFNNQGMLQLEDSQTKTLQGVLNNYNTVNHLDSSNLKLAYASMLVNRPGATYELESDANITGVSRWDASPKFINQGLFRKAGGNATSRIEVVFRNLGGTIEVSTGTLSLSGTGGAGSVSSNGEFRVAENATLNIGGNNVNVFNGSYSGSGKGQVLFETGRILVGTDFGDTEFDFKGGGFHWRGGTIEPVMGALINRGDFTLSGEDVKNLGAGPRFRNKGTLVHRGTGHLNLEYGGTCRNDRHAVYRLEGEGGITASGGEGPKPTFENRGRFEKAEGPGIASIEAEFVNRGVVEITAGILNFADHYVQTGGVTRLKGGDLSSSSVVDIEKGLLTGAGRVFASVQNRDRLAPGNSAGLMVLHGGYLQSPTGTLDIEIEGTDAGHTYDQLQVTEVASLHGRLRVKLSGDYIPSAGDAFNILTCRDLQGRFEKTDLPALPNGLKWDVRYSENGVLLAVASGKTP